MKRQTAKTGKKVDAVAPPHPEDVTPAPGGDAGWDGPTRAGAEGEIAELAAESADFEAEIAVEVSVGDAPPVDAVPSETVDSEATVETRVEDLGFPAAGELADAARAVDAALAGDAAFGPDAASVDALADAATVDAPADAASVHAAMTVDAALAADGEELPAPTVESAGRLESILESLLYAAEKPLTVSDFKRLVNERDGKKITAALEALRERHATTGIQLASLAGGWQFRTHPDNGPWVAKLVAGRPQRLTRAMLEALAIVAYRQPITRPEIDEIRGVDCGPVLKTLLDRGFIRILGKKEDVGRPMLYGTTAEFLKTFSLKDLSELPTLREFHELSEQQMAAVDAQAGSSTGAGVHGAEGASPPPAPGEARSPFSPAPMDLAPVDPAEEDALLEELDSATLAATRASGPPPGQAAEAAAGEPPPEAQN
jgi:segregation and condensation protein B